MPDFSFDSDDKRAAVRYMLENWPTPGVVCIGPRQMLAILDVHEKVVADNARLRGLIAKSIEVSGPACAWCEVLTSTGAGLGARQHDPNCPAFTPDGAVR